VEEDADVEDRAEAQGEEAPRAKMGGQGEEEEPRGEEEEGNDDPGAPVLHAQK
jgi:hypothetical protein